MKKSSDLIKKSKLKNIDKKSKSLQSQFEEAIENARKLKNELDKMQDKKDSIKKLDIIN